MATHLRVVQDLKDSEPVTYQQLGLIGDGKTPETNIHLLLEAVDEGGILKLGGSPKFLIRDTVTWSKSRGRILTSERRPFPDGIGVPQFLWGGARGGTMFNVDRGNQLHFDGFAIGNAYQQPDAERHGIAFNCDGGQDMSPGDQAIGSRCLFTRLLHLTNPPTADLVIDADPVASHSLRGPVLIAVSRTSGYSWEYLHFEDLVGYGQGAGTLLYFGASYNTKHHRIKEISASLYDKAIWMRNGSLHLEEANLSNNEWNIYLMGATEVCTEYKTTTEASRHHLFCNAQWAGHNLRLDPSHTPAGEAYITIGGFVGDFKLDGAIDTYLEQPTARVFGFEKDTSQRRVDLEFAVPWNMTLANLGLDEASLAAQGGAVRFRSNPHLSLPYSPGVIDLPEGELLYNWREPRRMNSAQIGDMAPSVRFVSDGPADWSTIPPGAVVEYYTGAQRRFQMVKHDGSRHQGIVGATTPVK